MSEQKTQWRVVGGRYHKCGGRIHVLCQRDQKAGLFMHESPAWCDNCGKEGEVYAEDGGIDFYWHSEPGDV